MKINSICIKRALRTFLQAFIAYIAVHITLVDFSDGKGAVQSALLGLAVSSIAAGVSAVMNIKGDNTDENG